jgi:hypothetical protein
MKTGTPEIIPCVKCGGAACALTVPEIPQKYIALAAPMVALAGLTPKFSIAGNPFDGFPTSALAEFLKVTCIACSGEQADGCAQ